MGISEQTTKNKAMLVLQKSLVTLLLQQQEEKALQTIARTTKLFPKFVDCDTKQRGQNSGLGYTRLKALHHVL